MKPEITPKGIGEWIKMKAPQLWTVCTRRIWLKLISLLLAIIVWNYVVSGDTSITRTKILYNVNGTVTGQATLSTYGLALLTDPAEVLGSFTVRMDVAQSQYSYVSTDNVRVTLDLSGVRTAGTQDIPLTASTTYGRVVDITPKTVSLTFESLDSRSIPVNVEFTGEMRDDLWYNVSRTNPTTVTVSGASSVVRSIAQAKVSSDVTNIESGYTRAEQYTLLDSDGNEINQSMLTRSSSSVTVVTDVLPQKELPVSTFIDDTVSGHVQEGYEITQVTMLPETVVVAADSELLEGISDLKIEPVNVEGASQTFTAKAKISLLSDFRYVSAEEVYVTVTIEKQGSGDWADISELELTGLEDGLTAEYDLEGKRAWISGDVADVKACCDSGVVLTCDVSGLEEGTYVCILSADTERYPNVSIMPESNRIAIKLTRSAD